MLRVHAVLPSQGKKYHRLKLDCVAWHVDSHDVLE
jgi:hypothetical protein